MILLIKHVHHTTENVLKYFYLPVITQINDKLNTCACIYVLNTVELQYSTFFM